jgi:hypothetical protein
MNYRTALKPCIRQGGFSWLAEEFILLCLVFVGRDGATIPGRLKVNELLTKSRLLDLGFGAAAGLKAYTPTEDEHGGQSHNDCTDHSFHWIWTGWFLD